MQYMLLIYSAETAGPRPGTADYDAMMAGYFKLNDDLKAGGHYIAGDALQPVSTATSVKLRAGKSETMDGPFAETKEALGGYYLIDVPDLDTALGFAAQIPTAAYGTVEVRPVVVWE